MDDNTLLIHHLISHLSHRSQCQIFRRLPLFQTKHYVKGTCMVTSDLLSISPFSLPVIGFDDNEPELQIDDLMLLN